MISFADRDVQHLREQKELLENQNNFLESEFQRQLDKIVADKNEKISQLTHIIEQTCPPPKEYKDSMNNAACSSSRQNMKLTRQIIVVDHYFRQS
jgi:DNA anti-recombination protein RmuC